MPTRGLLLLPVMLLFSCEADQSPSSDETAPGFSLVDASADSGIPFKMRSGTPEQRFIVEVKSTGVGLFDFDGDGLMDVVLTSGSTLDRMRSRRPGFGTRLYRNLGGMVFKDITASSGIPATGWACAPICADYDGDGRVDIYVTQFGPNILLRNTKDGFVDTTTTSGVGDDGWSTSAVFHDLDGDGDLDLYVCNYLDFDVTSPPTHGSAGRDCSWRGHEVMCGPKGLPPQADRCYRNEGGGRFTDVSESWGLRKAPPSHGLGVIAGDLDADGKPEIYVANDGMPNFWFDHTPGGFEENGYFVGVSWSEGGAAQAGMGVDAADVNGDGRDDIVCTNFSGEVNAFYLSQPGGGYIESSALSGTAMAGLNSLGWGVGMRDFNLDGFVDLFLANGHVYPSAAKDDAGSGYTQKNLLYLGGPDAHFDLVGFADHHPALDVNKVSRGAAFGDLDNDGDVDMVIANLNDTCTVVENRLNLQKTGHHFAGLRLVGKGANPDAIGSRVHARINGRQVVREVRRNSSFQASHDPRLVFGLGLETRLDMVSVRWPDGSMEKFRVSIDRYSTIRQGEGTR